MIDALPAILHLSDFICFNRDSSFGRFYTDIQLIVKSLKTDGKKSILNSDC
eukprot:m.129040 g.129040  ORF g.129040 m.129040 type:complete len:51 (+) comp37960_c0_seq26:1508-1660(+)